jgi:predicted phage baseplate assembly protein
MGLPTPRLDDRTFQDLVDDAKRLVMRRCPDWTDHNVSDPGVTLIEAFAGMVDQLLYRLNRVPDRNYVKFLELIGVELRPGGAARGTTTFWLAAPQPQPVLVRAETEVATVRTDVADPVVFSTTRDLSIVPCRFGRAGAQPAGGEPADLTVALAGGTGFPCFQQVPQVGDALLVGLTTAVPNCAVVLRVDCRISGVGVDPRNPPLQWEAWTGRGWTACDVDRDETGGLNQPGDVVLHVPDGHETSVLARERAGWLRCRLVAAEPEQRTYVESPHIRTISAFTIGGTAPIVNARVVRGEDLGLSDGSPAQQFRLAHRPVVPGDEPATLTVSTLDGVETWTEVEDFAQSGPTDRVFHLDHQAGELRFGPAVRQADGSLRCFGAVPEKNAALRLDAYRTGGGHRGNVAVGQIRVLKTSVPFVSRVENRSSAVGGAEAESLEDAKTRGPLLLRSRGRAVTAEDFVELTKQVAPEIARVQVSATDAGPDANGVRVLLVPRVVRDEVGRVRREDLQPLPESLARITAHLTERKIVGTRLVVEPPDYRWLTVVVSATARPRYRPEEVRADVLRALYGLFDPLTGGADGNGWPLGRAVQVHEVNAALAGVRGVDLSEEVSIKLFPAEAGTGRRGQDVQRMALGSTSLIHSFEHQVRIRT